MRGVTNLDSGHHQLYPKLDPLFPDFSNPIMLPVPEPFVVKNETNGLSTEPNSTTPSGHHQLYPKLDPLFPDFSNPIPVAEPFVVKNETNGLSTEPNSTTPSKKKKRWKKKGKSLCTSEGAEAKAVQSEHHELIPTSVPIMLPEPEPVVVKNETNGLSTEPNSTTPSKKRKRKWKSLSTNEGAEAKAVQSEHHELIPTSVPIMLPEPEPIVVKNETNGLSTEPNSTSPSKKKRKRKGKSLSTSEGAEAKAVQSEHHELIPTSVPIMLPEPEPTVVKNETNGLSTEPNSTTPSKKKRKRKGKSLSTSEGAEAKAVQSEHHELIPSSVPIMLPEPEPIVVKNETNGLSTEPNSTTPSKKKRKRKGKSLSTSEGAEAKAVQSEHQELIPSSVPIMLTEPEPIVVKNETNGLSTEPNSTTPSKKKRKRKGKSLSTSEGAEAKAVQSEHHELIPSSVPIMLPEPEPIVVKNETNGLSTEPNSTNPSKKKRKRKGKSLFTSEGAETNAVQAEHHELIPNLDPVVLSGPEPVVVKNEINVLSTEPNSMTPRKNERKKKRKRKGKSLSTSQGTETNDGNSKLIPNLNPLSPRASDSVLLPEPESTTPRKKKRNNKGKSLPMSGGAGTVDMQSEHRESIPNLDPSSSKDSDPVLLPEPVLVAENNETNQLCTELQSATPRKTRKRKGQSLLMSVGMETNAVHSEHRELIPNLDSLPSKDSVSVLPPEPEPFAEKNKANQVCTKPDSTPKLEQKKKGEVKDEMVKSIGPNVERSQQCHEAKPTTPEQHNQIKSRARVVNGQSVRPRPRVLKGSLKNYECYERCVECGQICQGGQKCGGLKLGSTYQMCFFCGTYGHWLNDCPISPGAKCAEGIIMLDAYVKEKCDHIYSRYAYLEKIEYITRQQVARGYVPTYEPIDTHSLPSNFQPYPAPVVQPNGSSFL